MTHFSNREVAFVPEMETDHLNEYKVMMAFDHMRLELKEFEWAYKYLPLI